jgi:molecular chaperone Hsp33
MSCSRRCSVAETPEPGELRRFLLETQPLRGQWVRLGAVWSELRSLRAYPPAVETLLGEFAAAAALLAATLKFEGTLTLQLAGSGRVRLLVAQCSDIFQLRAVAHHDLADGEIPDFAALVGAGRLTVTVQSDTTTARYQGIVPLAGASLAACLENYFASSEQLPTRLMLAADSVRAGGLLLQKLPDQALGGQVAGEVAGAQLQATWEELQAGLLALPTEQLLGGTAEAVVQRIAGAHDCRLFSPTRVRFACRCSAQRVADVLRSLGPDEAHATLAEQGAILVQCEFCGREYAYDAVDVEQLFTADASVQQGSDTVN